MGSLSPCQSLVDSASVSSAKACWPELPRGGSGHILLWREPGGRLVPPGGVCMLVCGCQRRCWGKVGKCFLGEAWGRSQGTTEGGNGLAWEPGYLGTWLCFALNELGDLSKPPPPSSVHPWSRFARPSNGPSDNERPSSLPHSHWEDQRRKRVGPE